MKAQILLVISIFCSLAFAQEDAKVTADVQTLQARVDKTKKDLQVWQDKLSAAESDLASWQKYNLTGPEGMPAAVRPSGVNDQVIAQKIAAAQQARSAVLAQMTPLNDELQSLQDDLTDKKVSAQQFKDGMLALYKGNKLQTSYSDLRARQGTAELTMQFIKDQNRGTALAAYLKATYVDLLNSPALCKAAKHCGQPGNAVGLGDLDSLQMLSKNPSPTKSTVQESVK